MKRLLLVVITSWFALLATANGQNGNSTLIKAGRLIDVRAGRVLQNQGILIVGDRRSSKNSGASTVFLTRQ